MWDRPLEALNRTPSGFAGSHARAFRPNGVPTMAARPGLLRVPKGQYDGFSPPGCRLIDPGDRHDDQPLVWGQMEARAN
jgi:hypothetical protein